jgi:hypothetical protein
MAQFFRPGDQGARSGKMLGGLRIGNDGGVQDGLIFDPQQSFRAP